MAAVVQSEPCGLRWQHCRPEGRAASVPGRGWLAPHPQKMLFFSSALFIWLAVEVHLSPYLCTAHSSSRGLTPPEPQTMAREAEKRGHVRGLH